MESPHVERKPSDQARNDWRYRAILEARSNQTPVGAVLLAIIGRHATTGPRIGPQAVIRVDGEVLTGFAPDPFTNADIINLGSITDLVDKFRTLADRIKATDAERTDMFTRLRQWVVTDHRAINAAREVMFDTLH